MDDENRLLEEYGITTDGNMKEEPEVDAGVANPMIDNDDEDEEVAGLPKEDKDDDEDDE